MCCTASCDFIHSLHEKGGTPSTVGPFTAHTPMLLLWSDVEVTLLSMAPKCLGLLVSRSYLDAMTYAGGIPPIRIRGADFPQPADRAGSRSSAESSRTRRDPSRAARRKRKREREYGIALEDVVSRAVVVVVFRGRWLRGIARFLVDFADVGDVVRRPVALSLNRGNRGNRLAERTRDVLLDGESRDLLDDPHQILGLLRAVQVHSHPLTESFPVSPPGCCRFRCCRGRRCPPRSWDRARACC